MLSFRAKEVVDIIAEVNKHPLTKEYLVKVDDNNWLPVDNILNGHISDVPEEYILLLERLSTIINSNLITILGKNSNIFYELKNHGYRTWVTESDSCGPLGAAISCQDYDWSLGYG